MQRYEYNPGRFIAKLCNPRAIKNFIINNNPMQVSPVRNLLKALRPIDISILIRRCVSRGPSAKRKPFVWPISPLFSRFSINELYSARLITGGNVFKKRLE